MINSIIQAVKPRLLDLKFIERYGGVVIPVTEVVESESGRERITFPVSCDIEGKECYERGNYFELAPNDQYRSVAYWELQGSASRQTPRRGTNYWQYAQRVRFVAWLNLDNLGIVSPCDIIANIILNVINSVEKGVDIVEDTPIQNVSFRFVDQLEKSMDIFRRYTYSEKESLMLYPFDFFALDFDVTWHIRKDCVIEENEYIAIECINE